MAKNEADITVHLILAQAYIYLKRFEQAQAHLTAVETSGAFSVKVTLLQAKILSLSGEKDKALSVLESLASDAKDAEVWLDLAELHDEIGKQTSVLTDLMEVKLSLNVHLLHWQCSHILYSMQNGV